MLLFSTQYLLTKLSKETIFFVSAQSLPTAMILGGWGHVTNKHLAEIPGTGFLLNTQSYERLHCLRTLPRIQDKIRYTKFSIISKVHI